MFLAFSLCFCNNRKDLKQKCFKKSTHDQKCFNEILLKFYKYLKSLKYVFYKIIRSMFPVKETKAKIFLR